MTTEVGSDAMYASWAPYFEICKERSRLNPQRFGWVCSLLEKLSCVDAFAEVGLALSHEGVILNTQHRRGVAPFVYFYPKVDSSVEIGLYLQQESEVMRKVVSQEQADHAIRSMLETAIVVDRMGGTRGFWLRGDIEAVEVTVEENQNLVDRFRCDLAGNVQATVNGQLTVGKARDIDFFDIQVLSIKPWVFNLTGRHAVSESGRVVNLGFRLRGEERLSRFGGKEEMSLPIEVAECVERLRNAIHRELGMGPS